MTNVSPTWLEWVRVDAYWSGKDDVPFGDCVAVQANRGWLLLTRCYLLSGKTVRRFVKYDELITVEVDWATMTPIEPSS